jgi:biopolymer transport protein ExbD
VPRGAQLSRGMNFRRGSFREEPEINLIPMIDVLLVILIFLMITTTYSKFAELKINLPQAEGEKSPATPNPIDVGVDAEGHYLINRKLVPFADNESFAQELKRAAGDHDDAVIVISADASATHQSVINIMSAARSVGLTHITFTTEAKKK